VQSLSGFRPVQSWPTDMPPAFDNAFPRIQIITIEESSPEKGSTSRICWR
jgi:hypothetical protein